MKLTRAALITVAAVFFLFGICGHAPLVPEKPKGPSQGMIGVVLACTTQTTDPKDADVAYQFDWGDGKQSAWSAFMEDGTPFADTHTYSTPGAYEIKARAKNSKQASGWSEPLAILVSPGEGGVRWRFAFTDPEDPEDSADFSLNTFAIDQGRDAAYVGCEYGAVIARKLDRTLRWEFLNRESDEYLPAPAVGDDGTVYIGCSNDSFYAINPGGTIKWTSFIGEDILATAALGANGTIYVHTTGDSLIALRPDGTRAWSCLTGGGNSSPVIGPDGTVFVASQDGGLYAIDPSSGTRKWTYPLSTAQVDASPAIDDSLLAIYVADEDGRLASVNLADGTENWWVRIGENPSSPVIGPDHTVYIGAGGKLLAIDHETGSTVWTYDQPMAFGALSAPAVSSTGSIYFLVTLGKKGFQGDLDSLYAVNSNGTRRWACALGEGYSDVFISSPKLDADGNIYIGSGLAAWCVRGAGGPAASPWPMFQRDARNTGRAQ